VLGNLSFRALGNWGYRL